jgi:hypothetical protein
MAVTASAVTKVSSTFRSCVLSTSVATGGTGPYTYQWYKSTVSGFTPAAGNLVAGATSASNTTFTGLLPSTTYYFKVVATDTGAGNATSTSAELSVKADVALTVKEMNELGQHLGSPAAAADLIKSIALRQLPSKATQIVFASAMTDNLLNKKIAATWEIFNSMASGTSLSHKTKRKLAYMLGSQVMALKIINMIQTTPETKLTI